VRFLVAESNGMGKAEGSAGRQDVAYATTVEVPGLSLDEYLAAHPDFPPQVIKLDIEGGEVLALPGMRALLQDVRPLLLLELHGPEAIALAWETLTRGGYRLARLRHGYPRVLAQDELDWKAYLVAFPDAGQL
jgi:hypothetical protein